MALVSFISLFLHNTQKSEMTELEWLLSDVILSPCTTRWCGKGNQYFCSNCLKELLGAPTRHLTLWFLHTISPTSLSCCQPTEEGCDVHQCPASSLPPVSQRTFKWAPHYNDRWNLRMSESYTKHDVHVAFQNHVWSKVHLQQNEECVNFCN